MISGSGEWAFLDVNSESSYQWATEVQLGCETTASAGRVIETSASIQQLTSDAVSPLFPRPNGSNSTPWGGMKTYFMQTSASCGQCEVITMSCDLDFRNRKIIFDEFMWWADPYEMPCLSASNGNTTAFYPLFCPSNDPVIGDQGPDDFLRADQVRSFWTGTGSLEPSGGPLIPPEMPKYGTFLPMSGSKGDILFAQVYVDARSGYLIYYQYAAGSKYISAIFRVSEQYPTRDPVSALYGSHNTTSDVY